MPKLLEQEGPGQPVYLMPLLIHSQIRALGMREGRNRLHSCRQDPISLTGLSLPLLPPFALEAVLEMFPGFVE